MNIRFTSSLTPEDENLIAPVILRALSAILAVMPIAYNVRIDTADSKVYQLSGTGTGSSEPVDVARAPDGGEPWRYQPEAW
ncbi:MAG: hypothetical protein AB7O32_09070 [Vicinamibacterales bacterium]